MADELVCLVLSAILGVLISLVVFVAKKKNDVKQGSSEATKEMKMVEEVEKKRNVMPDDPCLTTTLKGHRGTTLDLDTKVNSKHLVSSRGGLSPQPAPAADGDWQTVSAPITISATPQCGISMKGDCRLPLCAGELYRQLLSYRLTPKEMYRCGYPRPFPNRPGHAVWRHDNAAYSSCKTCCRCGSTFFITSGGEYYARDSCLFHTGRRCGSVFSCCGASIDEQKRGCQRSDYHICSTGVPRKKHTLPRGFVRTRPRPGVAGGVFALDCEMCFTIHGLEVTKVSVVGWNGVTIYEEYVKPRSPVLDYNTAFSGVTAEHLQNVQTELRDVQAVLLRLFTATTVLVGHGLENDLRVLKLIHDTVVDTSVVFPHHQGLPFRRSLRSLVNEYLNRDVQAGRRGHDSAEDARACMELVLWKAACDLVQRERSSGEAAE